MGKWKELAEPLDDRDAPIMKPIQEQVIAWYEQANGWSPEGWDKTVEELERFAALAYEAGRKDENEACAKVAENGMIGHTIAKAIRTRIKP